MKRNIALFFIVIVSSFVAVHPAFAQEHNFQDISQKIEKVSQGLAGRIGVAAQEIGSGVSATVNGDEAFVMASTYKVAIAVTLLDLGFNL
jgi:beta-lactamase class A